MIQETIEQAFKARPVGTDNNRAVGMYLKNQLATMGYEIVQLPFQCTTWEKGPSSLTIGQETIEIHPSPYSKSADFQGELAFAATLDELKTINILNKILILSGPLTQESLQPKNYPFYYPDEHRQLIELLEEKHPAAIVAATGNHPFCGLNPFPWVEDGNFIIPAAYISNDVFHAIQLHAGHTKSNAHIVIQSNNHRQDSCQIIGQKRCPNSRGRIVLCAHMDTKYETLGALDNGAGIAVLMEAARQLAQDNTVNYDVDIVPMNGEEYYEASGEVEYLKSIQDCKIQWMINVDSPCHKGSKVAVSLYNVADDVQHHIANIMQSNESIVFGPQWYAGDHCPFVFQGTQTMAIGSSDMFDGGLEYTHTMQDTLETIDVQQIEKAASFIVQCCREL